MMRPELVLADEPTGNLDQTSSRAVISLLREVSHEQGTTFLISTHDEQIAGNCDRILTIVDGRTPTRAQLA